MSDPRSKTAWQLHGACATATPDGKLLVCPCWWACLGAYMLRRNRVHAPVCSIAPVWQLVYTCDARVRACRHKACARAQGNRDDRSSLLHIDKLTFRALQSLESLAAALLVVTRRRGCHMSERIHSVLDPHHRGSKPAKPQRTVKCQLGGTIVLRARSGIGCLGAVLSAQPMQRHISCALRTLLEHESHNRTTKCKGARSTFRA
jgi:hypothetical protein